jgi:hypothetical protein
MTLARSNVLILVLLSVLLTICGFLVLKNTGLQADLTVCSEAEQARREERDFLMGLIPELNPTIRKRELASVIGNSYPNEAVNVLENHLQWRFFQFWFDENGRLEAVDWGS